MVSFQSHGYASGEQRSPLNGILFVLHSDPTLDRFVHELRTGLEREPVGERK